MNNICLPVNQLETKTCDELNLNDNVSCSNCKRWANTRISYPSRIRKSSCEQPWMFVMHKRNSSSSSTSSRHHRKFQTGLRCWSQFIENGIISHENVPENVIQAAEEYEFVLPMQSLPSSGSSNDHDQNEQGNKTRKQRRSSRQGQRTTRSSKEEGSSSNIITTIKTRRTTTTKTTTTSSSTTTTIKKKRSSDGTTFTTHPSSSSSSHCPSSSAKSRTKIHFLSPNKLERSTPAKSRNRPTSFASSTSTFSLPSPSKYVAAGGNLFNSISTKMQNLKLMPCNDTAAAPNLFTKAMTCGGTNYNDDILENDEVVKEKEMTIVRLRQELQVELNKSKEYENSIKQMASQLQELELVNQRYHQKDSVQSCTNYQKAVHKSTHSRNMKKKEYYECFLNQFKTNKFHGQNKFGRRLLSQMMAMSPKATFDITSTFANLARAQLLAEGGIFDNKDVSFEEAAKSCPKPGTFRNLLDEIAADVMFTVHLNLFERDADDDGKYPTVYFSCDKGPGGHFVKIVSWYSNHHHKVIQTILDVDKTFGDSRSSAEAM